MKNFILLLSLVALFSCEEIVKETSSVSEEQTTISSRDSIAIVKEEPEATVSITKVKEVAQKHQFAFGDIAIDVRQENDRLNIVSNKKNIEDLSHEIKGDLISFIETDVNADGFNEFYCITNQGDLVAYASYKNKSFGEIYVNEKPSHFYKDFNAVKSWEVKNNRLNITFSNGTDSHLNIVRYKLVAGEASYHLIAD